MIGHTDSNGVSRGKLGQRLLQWAAFGLFALGNPLYFVGCSGSGSGSSDDNYEYDQEDMLAVASGLEAEGAFTVGEYAISVDFPFGGERAAKDSAPREPLAPSYFSQANACGTRSFIAPAAACIDTTEMQLQGTLRIARGAEVVELAVTGSMAVHSRILTHASFDLDAEALQLSFVWSQDEGYRYSPAGANGTVALDALFAR